jgi:AhpD family alkylhydroperoxidase
METNWVELADKLTASMKECHSGQPDVFKAFGTLAKAANVPGALDTKTKELIALAIGIAIRCDGCIAFHARSCVKYGATREEIMEMISVAVYMGGGPSTVYGARALEAFDQFAAL